MVLLDRSEVQSIAGLHLFLLCEFSQLNVSYAEQTPLALFFLFIPVM
jgi:hypothetical protein